MTITICNSPAVAATVGFESAEPAKLTELVRATFSVCWSLLARWCAVNRSRWILRLYSVSTQPESQLWLLCIPQLAMPGTASPSPMLPARDGDSGDCWAGSNSCFP